MFACLYASYNICELNLVRLFFNQVFVRYCSVFFSVETEEAALLHEEATMTIEELLARYGQNLNAVKHTAAIR